MLIKNDYDSIEIEDLCTGYCLWCETDFFADSPAKVKRSGFMVYPVYQWLLHKNHTEKATVEKQAENLQFLKEHFMDKLIIENEMLRKKFFQSLLFQKDMVFDFTDDCGKIKRNKKLRTYMDLYDENMQQLVYNTWCNIEKKLYKIFYK